MPPRNLSLVIAVGVLLIGFGLLQGETGSDADEGRALGRGQATVPSPSHGPPAARSPAAAPRAEQRASAAPAPGAATAALLVRVSVAGDGLGEGSPAPAAGASVGLWRAATGTGAAFRPARRVAPDAVANGLGEARFNPPAGTPLEIVARSADGGPVARREWGVLDEPRGAAVEILVQPRPAALEVLVQSSGEEAQPIPGASIRVAPRERGPLAEFPEETRLERRTDGNGRCTIDGAIRSAGWLVVDAAGYSPAAIAAADLLGQASVAIELPRDATLEVEVLGPSGAAVPKAEVTAEFRLAGFAATRTMLTDSRGKAQLRRLPAATRLTISVIAPEQLPEFFPAVELDPGSQGTVRLELDS